MRERGLRSWKASSRRSSCSSRFSLLLQELLLSVADSMLFSLKIGMLLSVADSLLLSTRNMDPCVSPRLISRRAMSPFLQSSATTFLEPLRLKEQCLEMAS